MPLQRINRVLVRDFRNWRGEHEFVFNNENTVLYGPNGIGKSSLWLAILFGLLYKHKGKHADLIRPIGGGAGTPYVEVDFKANNLDYRIEKAFGDSKSTRFLCGTEEIAKGELADLECRKVLTGSDAPPGGNFSTMDKAIANATKGHIIDLIIPRQGSLSKRIDDNQSLSGIGRDADAETADNVYSAIIEWGDEDLKNILTQPRKQNGQIKKTAQGNLVNAKNELDYQMKKKAGLVEASADLVKLIKELNELDIELGEEESEDNTLSEINLLRKEAAEHQNRREDAEKKVAETSRDVTPLLEQNDKRKMYRKEIEKVMSEINGFDGQKVVLNSSYNEKRLMFEKRKQNYKTLESQLAALNEWMNYLQQQETIDSRKKELERLEQERDTLTDLIVEVSEKQLLLKVMSLASKEQWKRIRDISTEISSIQKAVDAWEVTKFESSEDFRIFIDEEEIAEAPDSVNTSIEIKDSKGNSKLRVQNTASLSKIGELEEERNNIFSKLAVSGTKELTARQTKNDELCGQLNSINGQIDQLNSNMKMEERIVRITEISAQLETTIKTPDSTKPKEGDWSKMAIDLDGNKNSAEKLFEESREEMGNAKDEYGGVVSKLKLLTSQRGDKEEQISSHVDTFGDDDSLTLNLAEARLKEKEAKAIAQPLTDGRDVNEEQKRTRAQNLQDQLSGKNNLKTRMVELNATINDRRLNGGLGGLAKVTSECQELKQSIAIFENDEKALNSLILALDKVKSDNIEVIRHRVGKTISDGASHVFGNNVKVKLGDDGFPIAVHHIEGRPIPFEAESYGTQEQLNLIYRIALAGVIAEEEKSGLCIIIDDPFGNTDVGRRQRMIEWMGAQMKKHGHQLILLTCRGNDFKGFGHLDDIRLH